MSNLRDLLPGYELPVGKPPQDFSVFNTNTLSTSNGGQCCLWTVPNDVSYAVFEMWSAGGSGGGGCCCMQGGGSGSGGYAVKGCTVSPGQEIRICAASSGCCIAASGGQCGCCTFVCSLGGGGQSTWESKVCGGRTPSIEPRCNYFQNCYGCCSNCFCCGGRADNTDFFIPGTQGSAAPTQFCFNVGYQLAANAPMTGSGMKMGGSGCFASGGSIAFGNFPGGGGHSAQNYGGGCCCGGPGGGGLVYVVYY